MSSTSPLRRVTYFFDVISPYSALSWQVLRRYRSRWQRSSNVSFELCPVFLGGVMKGSGNQPPALVAAKGSWLIGDLERNSALYDYPILQSPGNFFSEVARSIINVQRTLVAAQLGGADDAQVDALVTAFTDAVHADPTKRSADNDLVAIDAGFIADCCARSSFDATATAALVEAARSPEAKEKLKSNTEMALDAGAFGSPSFLIHGTPEDPEPFLIFGSDRFEQMCHVLDLEWDGVAPDRAPRSKM